MSANETYVAATTNPVLDSTREREIAPVIQSGDRTARFIVVADCSLDAASPLVIELGASRETF